MDASLTAQFLEAMHRFKRLNMRWPRAQDVRGGEFFVLNILSDIACQEAEGTEIHVSGICDRMNISMSAVSQILSSLGKRGLIERNMSEADRRKIAVRLTPQGEEIILRSRRQLEALLCQIVERLGEADAREFVRICGRMYEIIEDTV